MVPACDGYFYLLNCFTVAKILFYIMIYFFGYIKKSQKVGLHKDQPWRHIACKLPLKQKTLPNQMLIKLLSQIGYKKFSKLLHQ